jgi:ribosomal protein S18 acetylase RimI-like enzyme
MATLVLSESALYERMQANVLASWGQYAAGSTGARLVWLPNAGAAVFPALPERDVYNNALLARELVSAAATEALSAVEDEYSRAGVTGYAVWVHESEAASIAELERRRYHIDTCTHAMAMSLDGLQAPHPEVEIDTADWRDYLQVLTELELPEGLLARVDGSTFEVLVALLDGSRVATALAYDHEGDCGIYNVGTMPHARRRGLGTALTALQLHHARERGCTTASLQATEMAQRIYAGLGFRDLGRFIEFVR